MAPDASPNPIIVEPLASPKMTPPGSLACSPDPNSSSNSPNSSRPTSQYNSDTSQSEPPSPSEGGTQLPKNVTSQNAEYLSPSTPPALPSLPPSVVAPVNLLPSRIQPPRSVPPSPSTNITPATPVNNRNGKTSWLTYLRAKITKRRWVESTIGLLGLVVAVWLGVRGYKLAVWQSWNDLRQTCAAYKQSNTSLGPRCMKILEQGDPPEPPYWLHKWASGGHPNASSRALKREVIPLCQQLHGCYYDAPHPTNRRIIMAVIIVGVLLFGGFMMWKSRSQTKNEQRYTSAANAAPHSNVQLTRHHDAGPETVSWQGVVIKQRPEDSDYPGSVRRRLPHSRDKDSNISSSTWDASSYNSSSETLVAPWKRSKASSKVSLHDHSANEKHEGLIELDVAGKRKAFFKPSTGEFIHLAPWKSTHSDDEDSDDEHRLKAKTDEKHSIHRALGQMVAGGVSWAAGKKVDKKLAERLRKDIDRKQLRQPPQRAGDCLAGEVTNEWPTGKPTTV